jgi:hypothetical protein
MPHDFNRRAHMANARGPKRAAYQKKFNATDEEKARRAAQGRARYAYEKTHGDIPAGVDMAHKKAVKDGGGFSQGNLKPQSAKKNRGWKK